METLLIRSKNKTTSKLLQQLLKEIKGVEEVSVLNKNEKEEIALGNAIQQGKTGKYIDTDNFLQQLKDESNH